MKFISLVVAMIWRVSPKPQATLISGTATWKSFWASLDLPHSKLEIGIMLVSNIYFSIIILMMLLISIHPFTFYGFTFNSLILCKIKINQKKDTYYVHIVYSGSSSNGELLVKYLVQALLSFYSIKFVIFILRYLFLHSLFSSFGWEGSDTLQKGANNHN